MFNLRNFDDPRKARAFKSRLGIVVLVGAVIGFVAMRAVIHWYDRPRPPTVAITSGSPEVVQAIREATSLRRMSDLAARLQTGAQLSEEDRKDALGLLTGGDAPVARAAFRALALAAKAGQLEDKELLADLKTRLGKERDPANVGDFLLELGWFFDLDPVDPEEVPGWSALSLVPESPTRFSPEERAFAARLADDPKDADRRLIADVVDGKRNLDRSSQDWAVGMLDAQILKSSGPEQEFWKFARDLFSDRMAAAAAQEPKAAAL